MEVFARKVNDISIELDTEGSDNDHSYSNNSLNDIGGSTSSTPTHLNRSYTHWSPVDDGVTLAWRDLSVYVRADRYRRIINTVTGAVKSGSLVALMGASGAGKSTLMQALAHRQPGNVLVEGDILINGGVIGDHMKFISGYMHQEDLFVGALTVMEHMNIMARLKLDRRISSYERQSKIYNILCQLGLISCIKTRIGLQGDEKVLSGGEKKRLAFATELLTDPPLLFCDEPTTGLDSYSAQKLVTMMNLMTTQGKTIVCTIHQPSSELFAMFSQILLVADGRVAFMGSTQHAIDFFKKLGYRCPSNYNPADFFIRTLAIAPGFEESSKQTVKKICDNFAVSDAAKEIDVVVQYEFHMGRHNQYAIYSTKTDTRTAFWWTRIYWLTYRSLLECLRDPAVQGLRILQKIGIALMVGLCYLGTDALTQSGVQSVQGAIFILTAENTFMPMYSVLNLFPQEFPLFAREYRSGLYPLGVYYISKMLAILPGIIFEPVVFSVVTYLMSGLRRTTYALLVTAAVATLTMNVSIACGCFFSNLFGSVPTAMAYLVPFDVVLMVTQGVFIKLSSLPEALSWTQYLSWLMYSTEIMTVVQWQDVQNITCEIADPNVPCLTNGQEVMDKYSFSTEHFYPDLIFMLILYCVFHILGFLSLWRRAKKK